MQKRCSSFSVAVIMLALSVIGRLGYIIFSGDYAVSKGYHSYTLTVDAFAPTVYYSNMEKMTNNATAYVAVFKPDNTAPFEVRKLFGYGEESNRIIKELQKGYPIIMPISKAQADKVRHAAVFETKADAGDCRQLLAKSSSGLLGYLPKTAGERSINFAVDAKGRFLSGDKGTVSDEHYQSQAGLRLSIDKTVQEMTQTACRNIKSGCAVVMDVNSGALLALVVKPDHAYINKVFEQYAVGSVFKTVVAACALQNGYSPTYVCTGSITVGDTVFSCQKQHIHGKQNLKGALANSCNCYFVNLALTLGAEKLLKTMDDFGFADETRLYNGWTVQNARVPSRENLNVKGELALLGFGQGKLTASPLQMCAAMCTVAKGVRQPIKLVTGEVSETGEITDTVHPQGRRVLSAADAKTLREDLRFVVTNGTAANAETDAHHSAGKTATAQTGQYVNQTELLNTWFAGIYPYDNPRYAIVIMTENGKSGAEDCCPVFRTLVEMLATL